MANTKAYLDAILIFLTSCGKAIHQLVLLKLTVSRPHHLHRAGPGFIISAVGQTSYYSLTLIDMHMNRIQHTCNSETPDLRMDLVSYSDH